MGENRTEAFLEMLLQETIQGTRVWYPISKNVVETNPKAGVVLCEDEWHRVRIGNSFCMKFRDGYVFLIDEYTESGRDGTVFDGLVLYVQPNLNCDLFELSRDSTYLYRIASIISEKRKVPKEVEEFIKEFMDA